MLNLTIKDITHPDSFKTDKVYLHQFLDGELENFSWEKQIIHKNGNTIWINQTATLLRDELKKPLYFISVIQDISARKKMEIALSESNERFQRGFDTANIAINLTNLDGSFLQTNQQMSIMFGYTKQELGNMTINDLTHPEDKEESKKILEQMATGELENIRLTKQYLHKDGYTIWGQVSKAIIKDVEGKPLYFIAYIVDITEQKLAEDKLKQSEARFRMLFENAPVMIDAFDENGRCTMWNNECEKVFGWSAEEIFAHENPLALSYPDPEVRQQVIETIMVTPDNVFREWRPKRKDGSEVICEWANFKLPDGRTISVGRDITERKKNETKLQEYQTRLKSLAVQLTLAEEQERRRIAADLHDNVGQSLALTRLQLAAARKCIPKDSQQDIRFDDMSKSLLKTIQDTRHLIFELSSPSLNELGLGAAIEEWMQEQIADKHDIKIELFDHTKKMTLDNDLRAILFRNVRELLINVIKHAKAKNVSVWLEQEAEQLNITVQDNGVGFDSRLAKPKSNSSQGYGLFSVHERMADLGGKLEIVSQPGAGSKFVLHLPITPQKSKRKQSINQTHA